MAAIDDLANDITDMETAAAAVITYLDGLPALISDAIAQASAGSGDLEAKMEALAVKVSGDTQKLKDALAGAPVDQGHPSTSLSTSVSTSLPGVSSSLSNASTSLSGASSSLSSTL